MEDFLLTVAFLPEDLRLVPALISFSKLSMIHPSSSTSGAFPTFIPFFFLAASASFFAASLFSLFASRIALWWFSCKVRTVIKDFPNKDTFIGILIM